MTISYNPSHLLCEAVYSDIIPTREYFDYGDCFKAGYQKGHPVERVLDGDTDTRANYFTNIFSYGCAMYVGMKSRKTFGIFQGSSFP